MSFKGFRSDRDRIEIDGIQALWEYGFGGFLAWRDVRD
jgi:hypothetical protein